MTALVTAVLVASLLGSLHCAGMCGAFLAFAVGIDAPLQRGTRSGLHAAYHAGRLVTYCALGAAAGAAGAAFDGVGTLVGVQRVAVIVAGSSMVVFGVLAVLRLNGVRVPSPPAPRFMGDAMRRVFRAVSNRPPLARAFVTGLATTLLPCGWLWAFVITSAGTGSSASGALTMAVFWLGTLPVLVALGVGLAGVAGRLGGLGRRVPVITALAVVVVGLFTVFSRGNPNADPPAALARAVPARHELVDRVHQIGEAPAPCCANDDR